MAEWCTKCLTGWRAGHWAPVIISRFDLFYLNLPVTCCWNESKKQVYVWVWKWNSNDTCCLDVCSLSAWLRSPSPRKTKVSYIKTVLDITQNNNMAVRSETCSHWPSNIQKHNLTDARTDTAVVTYQDKQDHTVSLWLSIVKVLLRWAVNEVSDTKAGPETSQCTKKCTACPMDPTSGWH